jgi:hypothetical protein
VVSLTAAAGGPGCSDSKTSTAIVTVNPKPTVTVQLGNSKVCSAADTKVLSVNLTSSTGDNLSITSISPATCTADKTQNSEYQAKQGTSTCLASGAVCCL